jgi:RNA polymerase-binding transcription factor DksA
MADHPPAGAPQLTHLDTGVDPDQVHTPQKARARTGPINARRAPMKSQETRRQELEARLAELNARLQKIDAELDEPHSTTFSEAAIERETDEVLEDLGAAGLLEIRMIEAALTRMEKGEYGICVSCGDPISEERLDVLPHTPKCRNCAA